MDQWRVVLPDGWIPLFDDWASAKLEATMREYKFGVSLIPERSNPATGDAA